MKSTLTSRFSIRRLFLLTLFSFVAVASLLGIAATANKANRAAEARAKQAVNAKSAINPVVQNDKQPQAPLAPVIVATLTDNVTAATKVAPGGTINYTATITNNGAASPADDATNLNYSGPLDANTTLVAGSVHASPIAFNDTYNWVGNTFLDSAARALPAVTANDVAVNAPGGTDTFTVTAIAGGATTLGGTVTLASPSGAFTYTPPLNRPTAADGASVNDSFTYTITNNADPSLTSTGTVTITLTGRVFYLMQGAAGNGRSNTPSGNPATMSTNADKATDIFYIFSSATALSEPFTVDAGQQLLGSGVNLVVTIPTLGSVTLFNAAAPTPGITNAGTCVALAGAPGNNTLSGFNIGNCTGGTAIVGANVGTLNVSTMTINTNGGALDLTGVGAPTVSVVLGGTTSTGGARNVNLVGLNGTITLAGGALSGATGNGLHADGGNAGITFSGTIQNTGGRQVNIINKTGGTVALSGAIGGTGTGIFMNANNGATMNFTGGIALSTGTNAAFTATGPGPAATSGGTVNVTQNNTTIVNTLTSTTGTALNVANTTIGGSDLTFRSISAAGGTNGIIVNNTGASGGLTVTGNGGSCTTALNCTGGAIQNTSGDGVSITTAIDVSLTRMFFANIADSTTNNANCDLDTATGCAAAVDIQGTSSNIALDNVVIDGDDGIDGAGGANAAGQIGISGHGVNGLSVRNTTIKNVGENNDESGVLLTDAQGTVLFRDVTVTDPEEYGIRFYKSANTSLNLTLQRVTVQNNISTFGEAGFSIRMDGGTANVLVDDCDFLNTDGPGVDAQAINSAILHTTVQSTIFTENRALPMAVNFVTDNTAQGFVMINSNTVNDCATISDCSLAFDLDANRTSTLHAIVTNNNVPSGTGIGSGMEFVVGDGALGRAEVRDNIITVNSSAAPVANEIGMTFHARNEGFGGTNGRLDVIFEGNTLNGVSSAGTFVPGVQFLAGSSTGTHDQDVCVNTSTGAGAGNNSINGTNTPGLTPKFEVRMRTGTSFFLQNFAGTGTLATSVASYFDTNNSGTLDPTFVGTGGTNVVNYQAGNCNTPTTPTLPPVVPLAVASGGVEALFASSAPELSQADVDNLVVAAMERWTATGLKPAQIRAMHQLKFELSDLAQNYLGEAGGDRILIDRRAQGKGWFIDTTPSDDLEFNEKASATRSYTSPFSAAAGRIDLLTAIEHEIGHKLGLNDSYAEQDRDNLMYGYLTKGERRLPLILQAWNAVPNSYSRTHFLSAEPIVTTPAVHISAKDSMALVLAKTTPKASAEEVARIYRSERPISHHAVRSNRSAQEPNAPTSGETVTLNPIATFPAGKLITIKYSATVNAPPLARQVSTQGTVTANGGAISVLTDDPEPAGPANPTVTLVDTLMTWNGVTSTDWNTATNWTPPAGGTQYAPGVSNPAVNEVVIPNVGNQPTISATDIGIYSLSLANTMTLTITNPRVLTIGGSPGGDLTLDGIISGGNLNLGTGTHVINVGASGSLSSTNVATVLSGSTVTLNNNLQAGALTVNAGGSMNITNRTLSLNGAGAALAVPGGATFTTTGSTVIFNGTAAQQAAGIAYNNLTINNTIGLNVTGVTLTGNATVNGVLALTSSDLNTSTFTLTQPNTTASTGVSDVVGTITRTAAFGTTTITFGNPNNQITFGAAGTKPTSLTVVMAKTAPATYAAAVQRNYTISQVGANTSTATVRLHYLDSEVTGLNSEATLNLRRLRTSDSHWVAQLPTVRDTTANWVESNAVAGADLPTQWTFSSLSPTASDGVVTGRIVDDQGLPVEGALVRLEGTQNRKFITDANGFYRFDNVETSGFYTVTPSRVNYLFSPATRSFSLLGETTQAIFGATRTDGTVNPLDTPEYFVRQHYLDFLGREPDEAGFNFWSDQILECANDNACIERRRENVSAAYFLSIEFQKTGGLVDGLYRAAYGVRPDFGQFMPDTRAVGLGVQVGKEGWEATLNANKAAFVAAFVNRPAFVGVYGNMEHNVFVETLIGHTGVSFTSSERDLLVSGLTTGTMTRAEALQSIAENNRFANAKFNDAFVMMEYFGYLRRNADPDGFAFWLNKLIEFDGNFERAEMVKAFIVSGEYRDRFPR